MHHADRNIKQRAPEQPSCISLKAGVLPAPACNTDGAVFLLSGPDKLAFYSKLDARSAR